MPTNKETLKPVGSFQPANCLVGVLFFALLVYWDMWWTSLGALGFSLMMGVGIIGRKLGHTRLSLYVSALSPWFVSTYATFLTGGIESPTLVLALPSALPVAYLLGWRWALWHAAGSSALIGIMWRYASVIGQWSELPAAAYEPVYFASLITCVGMISIFGVKFTHTALSAQHSLENALDELRQKQSALDTHSAVVITDNQGRITHANDHFCELSEYSREELIGQTHKLVSSGFHPSSFWQEMWTKVNAGETWRGEIKNRAKSGREYWVDTSIMARFDAAGEIEGYAAIRTDVTERKEAEYRVIDAKEKALAAEEAALAAKEEAEEALKAKSAFLATMSHELRTPMNGVLGMAQLLLDTDLDDDQQDQVRTLKSSGEVLMALINDVLDFSKMEAGKLVLESAPFELSALSKEVIGVCRPKLAPGVELSVKHRPSGESWVLGDPLRLRQVLFNLLGNAVKFTQKGEVSLNIEVHTKGAHREIHFAVVDTGIGIAEEARQRLFNPFTQADSTTTRNFGGTGLGLAICRRIVESMGSTIEVSSVEGEGSTFAFTVTLPIAEAIVERGWKPDPPTVPDAGGVRILVVEDNPVNQRVARRLLETMGAEVTLANNGQEGLDRWNEDLFDVVFMDCQMPVMDGFEATQAIRARESGRRTPIVAMTANAMAGDRERCLEVGMDDYIAKPFTKARLAEVLTGFCAQRLMVYSTSALPARRDSEI